MAIIQVSDEILNGRPTDWPEPGEMYFRLSDSLLGSLDLSCDTGYVVRSYDFGSPEIRETTYPNALDDGNFDATAFIGPRAVNLDMVLRNSPNVNGTGAPMQSEAQMRDALMKYIHPSRRPLLLFSEHGDDRVRYVRLRGSDAMFAVARPQFNELSASWVAPSGVIENTDYHQAVISFGGDLASEYHIRTNNQGTVPAHWQLTIEGALDNPLIELSGYSQWLWLNYHVEEPTTVVIDSQTKTVRLANQPVGYRYLDDRSDWFRVPPGESTIVISHTAVPHIGASYGYWDIDPLAATHGGPARWSASTSVNVSSNPAYLADPASYANLIDLKTDPIQGDGLYTGQAFGEGEYVLLGNASQVWYDAGVWVAGYRPVSVEQWIWALPIVPETGEPASGRVTFTYREAYL